MRTAWLYGAHGPNFAKTMLRLAGASKDTWSVVDDQVGQPTWTVDLARQIVALLDADAPAGIYHGTNSGQASWFEFARAVLVEAGPRPRAHHADRQRARSCARRRARRTRCSATTRGRPPASSPMRDWREALADAAASGVFAPAAS